ncbi:MAG: VWA domain-containing protein [Acidobacteriota bacterium]
MKGIPVLVVGQVFIAVLAAGEGVSGGERVQIAPRAQMRDQANRSPLLRATSSIVLVPVTVRGTDDTPVRGLTRDAFRVFEDGVEREIESFAEEEGPVSIGVVFDASKSMQARLGQSRTAVARLADTRLPGDEYLAVAFNDSPYLLCALTADVDRMSGALNSIVARGWTSLYDGIYLSAGLMRTAANTRRSLLILSDGEDNFSRYSNSEVRAYLREAGVTVYAIGLPGAGLSGLRGRALRRLTEETGGWFLPLHGDDEVAQAVTGMSRTMRSQYVIGIRPANSAMAGKYRRVQVKVEQKGAEPWRVSWRSGYYGPE